MQSPLLTDDEMKEVSGHTQHSKQCRWLTDNRILFHTDKNGKPHTTWYNFNHPIHLRNMAPMDEEPDFGAMRA